MKRFRAVSKSRWARWPLKILCGVGMTALAALGFAIKAFVLVGTAVAFIALLVVGPNLDYFVLKRRYRKHSQYGLDLRIELSEDGIRFLSSVADSHLRWGSFISAASFADGLMLYLAPWHYVWLPDCCVVSGDVAQARLIAKAKIDRYQSV